MARRQLAGPLGIACLDRIGDLVVNAERDAALAYRWVLASGRRLVGPPLQVAAPQRLKAANHRDHRVVAAAADNLIVELAADLGEAGAVVDVFGHGLVEV